MASTIYDVARLARVSAATVSRALSGKRPVSQPTRDRVEAAIKKLDYRPNGVARSLALMSTRTIALVLPDITNPYFPALVKGAQDLADTRGYSLVLCNTNAEASREEAYLRVLKSHLVDGAILVGLTSKRRTIVQALGPDMPTVFLDRGTDIPGNGFVHADNGLGAFIATRHLLQLGHTAIAHIRGPRGLEVSEERVAGYARALAHAGVALAQDLIVDGDFTEEGGRSAIANLVGRRRHFTAVFAANDLMAIGAMSWLQREGIRVPVDVSIVGFDDIGFARYVTPALTTVRQPTYEMGRTAAELLINIRERGVLDEVTPPVVFTPDLVVRASTAALAAVRVPSTGERPSAVRPK